MKLVNGQRQLQLGSMPIDYTLQRSTRRTIGFVISDSGLRVTAPRWVLLATSSWRSAARKPGSSPSWNSARSARAQRAGSRWNGVTAPACLILAAR